MALVPDGQQLAINNAGTNPTITQSKKLSDTTITVGSTTFNTHQAWTYGQGFTLSWTRYIRNLTGGTVYGYSPNFLYGQLMGIVPDAGVSAVGDAYKAMLYSTNSYSVGTSGTSSTQWTTPFVYPTPSLFLQSNSSPWGITTNATSVSTQFPESTQNTYSYQALVSFRQAMQFGSPSNSIGSFGNSGMNGQKFTSTDGTKKWSVLQCIWGKNTQTTGSFPNMKGPYSGSHETGSNAGNFVFMYFANTDPGYINYAGMAALDASDFFSHIKINGGTTVLRSHLTGHTLPAGHSAIGGIPAMIVGDPAGFGEAGGYGFLWTQLTDSQIDALGTTSSGSVDFEVYGPQTTATYNNGLAEEFGVKSGHGSVTSPFAIAMSHYVKGDGSNLVGPSHTAPDIKSTDSNVAMSDYYDTKYEAPFSGVNVTTGVNQDYYPGYGAGKAGYSAYYLYAGGYGIRPAYGGFTPGSPTITGSNGVVHDIIEIAHTYSNNGTALEFRVRPQSGSTSNLMLSSHFTSVTWNKPGVATPLTLTPSSSGFSRTTETSSLATGHLVPNVRFAWTLTAGSNTAFNTWRGAGGTSSNFNIVITT